ncbi:hypothetical protein EVA_21714 [gut metagenome]|uniref:Uncharacterized protein n=1 Tax=gut metagenome TaxID=749906 RepID=J9BRI0_9ZZZZ
MGFSSSNMASILEATSSVAAVHSLTTSMWRSISLRKPSS